MNVRPSKVIASPSHIVFRGRVPFDCRDNPLPRNATSIRERERERRDVQPENPSLMHPTNQKMKIFL